MKKLLALSGLVLAASSTAQAVEQPYLGVAFAQPTFEDDRGGDATPSIAQLRFGTHLSKHFGLQAEVSVDAGEDTLKSGGVSFDFSVDSMYTVSAVARMPLGDEMNIYGKLGYSYAQVSLGNPSIAIIPSREDNLDGITFGAGIVLPAFWGLHPEVDFTSYLNGDDTLGGIGFGVRKYL